MHNLQKKLIVKCKVDECGRDAMYIEKELCQKHYFRIMRNGHVNLLLSTEREKGIRNRKDFFITPNGYKRVYSYNHPLARKHWVFEHRFLIYQKYGEALPSCELCGKSTNWKTCHIDHKDKNTLNNDLSNLRPLCRPCNTGRTERSNIPRYEYLGKMMTVTQLAKIDGCQVCRAHLKRRIDAGISIVDAMFSKNLTHPKKPKVIK